MIKKTETPLTDIKKSVLIEAKILEEIINVQDLLGNSRTNGDEKKKLEEHLDSLKVYLKKTKEEIVSSLESIKFNPLINPPSLQVQLPAQPVQIIPPPSQPLEKQTPRKLTETEIGESLGYQGKSVKEEAREEMTLERTTIKRLKKKEQKVIVTKVKKPSIYLKNATKTFGKLSRKLVERGYFRGIERDLIRANMEYIPAGYVSVILYTIMLSFFVGVFAVLFFMFFDVSATLPLISLAAGDFMTRFLNLFWIAIVVPIGTFFAMYYYPTLERGAQESKINQELPFATIHMAAISGSMIDPSKIFQILIITGEYPAISREFTKLLNQINVYGYDLVGALRNMAFNCPSRKLSDLLNSLATAITSGGDLPDFFGKRASTLLFEYRLEKEQQAKAAETFMDIYISVVIAAPMILMLLLMMLKIGGLGIALSTSAITLTMVLGVVVINLLFLAFLHIRQPAE